MSLLLIVKAACFVLAVGLIAGTILITRHETGTASLPGPPGDPPPGR